MVLLGLQLQPMVDDTRERRQRRHGERIDVGAGGRRPLLHVGPHGLGQRVQGEGRDLRAREGVPGLVG